MFSILVGIPITAVVALASIYGLTFGLVGFAKGDLILISMGLVNITGIIGAIGAWKRIYTTSAEMTEDEKHSTRIMLYIGAFSSLCISVSLFYFSEIAYAFVFILLSLGSAVFIYATPKNQ
jgi:hypothetical protein